VKRGLGYLAYTVILHGLALFGLFDLLREIAR
jgi:hypothetical protein